MLVLLSIVKSMRNWRGDKNLEAFVLCNPSQNKEKCVDGEKLNISLDTKNARKDF